MDTEKGYWRDIQEIAWDVYFKGLKGYTHLNLYRSRHDYITDEMSNSADPEAIKSVKVKDLAKGGAIDDLSDPDSSFDIDLIVDRLDKILSEI